jgi:hypothetical protein
MLVIEARLTSQSGTVIVKPKLHSLITDVTQPLNFATQHKPVGLP